jgi:hypothetical protein
LSRGRRPSSNYDDSTELEIRYPSVDYYYLSHYVDWKERANQGSEPLGGTVILEIVTKVSQNR